jgi:hypothetical protein
LFGTPNHANNGFIMPELLEDPTLYVIRRGRDEYGPFGRDILRQAMEMGNLVEEDWVRVADHPSCWYSLGRLLAGPPPPLPPIVRIRRSITRWLKVWSKLAKQALSAGNQFLNQFSDRLLNHSGLLAIACIAAATAIVFFPDQPLGVSIPWMLGGVATGIAMVFRRKSLRGVLACLFSVLLPIGASRAIPKINEYTDPNYRENALPPIGEMYSTVTRRAPEVPRSSARVVSGIPALGLPQPAPTAQK